MTPLERAAMALMEVEQNRPLGAVYDYRAQVRAVLMAVREMPSETQAAIFDARDGFVHEIDIPAVWEAGIDAILADGGE